jgi:hypothetical protein
MKRRNLLKSLLAAPLALLFGPKRAKAEPILSSDGSQHWLTVGQTRLTWTDDGKRNVPLVFVEGNVVTIRILSSPTLADWRKAALEC